MGRLLDAAGLARRHLADILFVLLASGILAWVAWDAFSFRIVSFNSGADYWEHTAVLRALIDDPFDPRHPLIASAIGSPRFNPHLLGAALVARALALDALDAMAVSALGNTLLFLLGIWLFLRVYFGDARASLFGLPVFFGAWLDAPHFSNVYQLDIYFSVAGYPSTAALGMTLIGLALTVRTLRSEGRGWLALFLLTLLWADVVVTHPLTATMGLSAAALLAATEPGVPLRRRLRVGGTALLGVLVSALWPYYPALDMVVGGTASRVKRDLALGERELHSFYALSMLTRIVGVSVVALPVFGYFLVRRRHLFLPLGAILMWIAFAVSAFVPIPLGHRYVLLAMPFLHVALVWLLLALVPRDAPAALVARPWLRLAGSVGVGAFLLLLIGYNVRSAHARFAAMSPGLKPRQSLPAQVARRVGTLAGPHAVVLGTPLSSWSLPTFGPKIVALHHRNPLITDADERNHAALVFLAAGTSKTERIRILDHYGVTHVIVSGPPSRPLARFLLEQATEHPLPGRATLHALDGREPVGASEAMP